MAYEGNDNGSSARPVRLAGRGSGAAGTREPGAPVPDTSQNPDFTGVGAPRVRTTGDRASYEGKQAADIRRGIDDQRTANASEQRRPAASNSHAARPALSTARAGSADESSRHHPSGGHSPNRSGDRVPERLNGKRVRMPDLHASLARPAAGRKGPARVGESLRGGRGPQPQADKARRRIRIAVLSVIICALFVFLGSLAFHGTAGIEPKAEFKLIDEPLKPTINFSFSTPRNRWRAGEVPHIYQTDPLWAEKSYAGGTIRKNACGPTCLTMVYVYKTGKTDMTPVEMCKLAEDGNYAPTGATEWSFMLYGAASLGLNATQLQIDRDDLEDSLKAGDAVIASVRPGTFTNVGHYIVLHGIDDTGHVTVYDPNSEARSLRKWGIVEVLDEVNALWAY